MPKAARTTKEHERHLLEPERRPDAARDRREDGLEIHLGADRPRQLEQELQRLLQLDLGARQAELAPAVDHRHRQVGDARRDPVKGARQLAELVAPVGAHRLEPASLLGLAQRVGESLERHGQEPVHDEQGGGRDAGHGGGAAEDGGDENGAPGRHRLVVHDDRYDEHAHRCGDDRGGGGGVDRHAAGDGAGDEVNHDRRVSSACAPGQSNRMIRA
jgi:hypothetical protein